MKKIALFAISITTCVLAFAQPASTLTIFSEEGNKFYLILNGLKQNDRPETNIRIENLTQPYYNGKIIFEDKALSEITKNIPLNSADNTPQDVTFKIKTGKDGKQVMRFFSANAIVPGTPPARPVGVTVYNSGVTTPISQTTTTTTITQPVSSNIDASGNHVRTNVNVPADATVIRETTTSTVTTSSPNMTIESQAPAANCNGYPMTPGDFESAKAIIQQASFEDSKLSSAKEIAGSNCLYAAQITEICTLFGFEKTKLTFAEYAYKRCIDPQNYFKVNNAFQFDASKKELSKYLGH